MQQAKKKNEKAGSVGERYLVSWKNGQQHYGDIIEVRPIKPLRETGVTECDKLAFDELEYYVHYPNFDRRLDEWVTADRIDVKSLTSSGAGELDDRKKIKRKLDDMSMDGKRDDKEASLLQLEKEHEEITKVKNIQCIVMGKYETDTWYFSPYPDEYSGDEKLYICEYCLKYMKKNKTLVNHSLKCNMTSPPGKLIYLEGGLSMFEIDGKDNKIYCQNLCLLSKLFLDHKTLYYDVDPFLFYVLCEVDEENFHHIVGYFSKEKQSNENYNLACILTFPAYQRKGYGKFLMSVSYELTKREGTTGSPEKPLSDLGKISYRSFWTYVLLKLFNAKSFSNTTTLSDVSKLTGFKTEDILSTLHSLNMIKYWKGQHVISINKAAVEQHLEAAKRIRLCNPDCLTWQPPKK